MAAKAKKGARSIIIRREEVVEGAHHGGAWKVAYADFVTAMMAFFLLMWLINATTDKQRRGIADYFSPVGANTRSLSGSGKPFGGLTPYERGSLVSNLGVVSVTDSIGRATGQSANLDDNTGSAAVTGAGTAKFRAAASDPDAIPVEGDNHGDGATGHAAADTDGDGDPVASSGTAVGSDSGAANAPATASTPAVAAPPPAATSGPAGKAAVAAAHREEAQLTAAADDLRKSVEADPAIGAIASQLAVDVTPEGLRIQIIDADGKPMFDNGSTTPNARARMLLAKVAPVLARLNEPMSIVGHTDAAVCQGSCRSNWDLSASRAESSRVILEQGGFPDTRLADVTGLADHDLLLPAQPLAAANRRIVMVVHRQHPLPAPGLGAR